ncbi:putative histone-like DNA-binding protein [Bacteroides zoogleoformans]|nr:putative histone-like DNA-binding protein [Bacteroides zoogleoformans]
MKGRITALIEKNLCIEKHKIQLTEKDINLIESSFKKFKVHKGECLIKKDELEKYMYIVEDGIFRYYTCNEVHQEDTFGVVFKDECLNPECILTYDTRTVKLDGVGTFYYTASASKKGVKTAEEVNASQINGVRVRFLPEVGRTVGGRVTTRSMVDTKIVWEEWGKVATPSGKTPSDNTGGTHPAGSGETGGQGSGEGNQSENPLS